MNIRAVSLVFAAGLASPGWANDSMATLAAGGLVFVKSEAVKMVSEDLYVSPDMVRVTYRFLNEGDTDVESLVAFPMPDIIGSPDFLAAIPTEDPENIFGFETRVNGEAVEANLHQYAFAHNIEYTSMLLELGLPLAPHTQEAAAALDGLGAADQERLSKLGLVVPMEFDSGQGWQKSYFPVWTLKSTYSWQAVFPAGEEITVEHEYRPSVGGTVAVTFLGEPYEDYDPAADYLKKYCTDDGFVAAVRRTLPDPDEPYGAPFTESWLSYVWSTGANWNGPVGSFHLTVDKGRPENLVSFCWDGEVTKTSPTTFEMEAQDWWPPWNRELEILILNRQEPN